MPRANKLKELAHERDTDVITMVKEAVEKHGGINGAARVLRVRQNSIRHALQAEGLTVKHETVVKVVPYEQAV